MTTIKGMLFFAALLVVASGAAQAENYICRPLQTAKCSTIGAVGCEAKAPSSDSAINLKIEAGSDQGIVTQCGGGCGEPGIFPLEFSPTGITAVKLFSKTMVQLFHIDTRDMSFTFTWPLNKVVMTEAGYCHKK